MLVLLVSIGYQVNAQKQAGYQAIYSGVPWFDDQGNTVSAHAAGIIKDNGRYYLFGEKHTDTGNAFAGFNCYSSTDLYNWKFESLALPVQDTGRLGPNRVGERVKVMKCPNTGEYVMFMHTDDLSYKDQCVGYATSKTITGPYIFQGPVLFEGKAVRKWDMGTYQDNDGSGYILFHSGDIYRLSADYHSITELVIKNLAPECESPAVFKKGNLYYWLGSHRTSWERNDNFYYTATSLKGAWTARGSFAPPGTLTWNSQTTFVLPVEGRKDTTYVFMGDRWSYPLQASSATYVWQPLTVSGSSVSIPKFLEGWDVDMQNETASQMLINGKTTLSTNKKAISYKGNWTHQSSDTLNTSSSDKKGDSFSAKFNGRQIGFYSFAGPNGGYAQVILTNTTGKVILTTIVDLYSNYSTSTLKFLSPILQKGNYTLTVSVMAEHSKWADKRKNDYGSKGNYVYLNKIIIN